MDNINDMTDNEIHERAFAKVWSRIQNCNITIHANREDIKHKRYGSLEPEDLEQILNGNIIDRKVWSYILTLIEKNDTD
jgi:hypothetical protein